MIALSATTRSPENHQMGFSFRARSTKAVMNIAIWR
jgi:hypothetical protein